MAEQREWVRDHRVAGFVAGRFTGVFEGEQHELVAVQTMGQGVVVVPANALLPVDTTYMLRQAGLDLEWIISAIVEGGFTLDDAQAAWDMAMAHMRGVAEGKSAAQAAAQPLTDS